MNLAIFGALMVLTALTVWAAFQDFGPFDTPIALVIACIKATLVIMFFMHVKYSSRIVMMSAGSGFLFLVFLIAFTFVDKQTRVPVPAWPESVDTAPPFEAPEPPAEGEGPTTPGGV
jgi:caa(3)-type oxidase subunit IV